jgi:hypothetical protein
MPETFWARLGWFVVSTILWLIATGLVAAAFLAFSSWLGGKLHVAAEELEADYQAELRRQERCRKQAVAVTVAEEIAAMPDTPERRRLYREAEALGFLDSDDLPRERAS